MLIFFLQKRYFLYLRKLVALLTSAMPVQKYRHTWHNTARKLRKISFPRNSHFTASVHTHITETRNTLLMCIMSSTALSKLVYRLQFKRPQPRLSSHSAREEQRLVREADSHWKQHRWFSGRMLACHAGGPGSIPGRCSCKNIFWSP